MLSLFLFLFFSLLDTFGFSIVFYNLCFMYQTTLCAQPGYEFIISIVRATQEKSPRPQPF